MDPALPQHRKTKLNVVVSNGYQPLYSHRCSKSLGLASDKILLLSNESLFEGKDRKKKQNLLFNKVIRAVPRRTFPQRIFSGSDISPKNLFIYLFILTFIYRWYTKVAGTNEFQQKIYKITLKTN